MDTGVALFVDMPKSAHRGGPTVHIQLLSIFALASSETKIIMGLNHISIVFLQKIPKTQD
jgi:hypothetical protein